MNIALSHGIAVGLGAVLSTGMVKKFKLREKMRAYLSQKSRATRILLYALIFLLVITVAVAISILPMILFPENELIDEIGRGFGMGIGIGTALGLFVETKK